MRLHFNTQRAGQIDGLRHFAYQRSGLFYTRRSTEDILKAGSLTLEIHQWYDKGLFAGRCILVDYNSYAERHGKAYDATGGASITYNQLMACLAGQSQLLKQIIEVRKGDMLLIGCCFTHKYVQLAEDQEREIRTHNASQYMWDGSRRKNARVPTGEVSDYGERRCASMRLLAG